MVKEKLTKEDFDKYWTNRGPQMVFIVIWAILTIILFLERFLFYLGYSAFDGTLDFRETDLGYGIPIARGAASALKFNCGLILLTVCRNILTWIRKFKFGRVLPIDHNIEFHKGLAWVIAFFSLMHVSAHFFNFKNFEDGNTPPASFPADLNDAFGKSPWALAFTTIPGSTGHITLLVMVLMYSSAVSRIRRPMFEVFWYTHHLFVVFYICLIVHGMAQILEKATFWYWVIGPLIIYIIERIIRLVRGKQDTILKLAVAHPSKVLELQMQKTSFNYQSGQYLFLACPYLASHEWHPFTITSCPDEDYVSVHIRIVGDWTGALWKMMNPDNTLGVVQENKTTADDGSAILKIDGPFGAASEDVFKYENVMLVGAGIGVTPFASILKSCRYAIERQLSGHSATNLRKVYFYWISRDREAFEWFSELLSALEEENINNFLEIRAYLTGALKPDEIRNVMYGDDEADAITGLESRTQFGRPDWKGAFAELARNHPDSRLGIFFCGPDIIARQLLKQSKKFTKETNTKFEFHKENF